MNWEALGCAKTQILGEIETEIAGQRYQEAWAEPGERVNLEREPENVRDRKAIRVENGRFEPVGYLPRKMCRWLAPLIDAGKIRLDGYVPARRPREFDRPRTLPLTLIVYLTGEGQGLLRKREARSAEEALHQLVRAAFVDAETYSDAEIVRQVDERLRPLARKELLPETHLLLNLLPRVAQELEFARSICVLGEFRQTLADISIGEPQSNDRVSIFPLFWPEPSAPDYCLLSQAISENLAVVEEASENGDVPSLRLTSRCDRPILVPDGEILVGAKQNRVVNVTVLVAPFAKFSLPVSCVEQGRWRYKSRAFASAACCAPPSLRSKKTRSVQRSRELTGSLESDQGEVWEEVAEGLRSFGVHSHTRSLADGFAAVEEELQAYRAEFSLPEHAAGVVVTTGSKIIGMELFDSPETLSAVWDRLSRAYFFDALRGRKQDCRASRSTVEQFLARIADHARRRFPAAGMGDELEIAADGVVGAALLHCGRICHLAAFSEQT